MQAGAYNVESVFEFVSPELAGELVAFWLREGALQDREAAAARTREVVCIARDPAGGIASVNTVYLGTLQHPDDIHYFYRMYTRPRHRLWELSAGMLRACVETLRTTSVRDPRARGLVIVSENPKLQTPAGHRVLAGMGWSYLGKTPQALDVWKLPLLEAIATR